MLYQETGNTSIAARGLLMPHPMNNNTVNGNWNELKGKIKQQWALLTDDHLKGIEGNFDEIKGRVEKTYGYTKDKAHQEVEAFRARHKV